MNKYTTNAIQILKFLELLYSNVQKNILVNGTSEIINAHLEFDPNDYMVYLGESRKAQYKYVENESSWYDSMDRCIKGHPGIETNPIWSRICTDNGIVNSNYGWCVFSPENGDGVKSQYDFALQQLLDNPNGRQSVIYYSRPAMQWEWNDNVNAKSDFTCTFCTQHFIRDNTLFYIVNMRSNDIIRGLHCGDLPHHGKVYNRMYEDLKHTYPDLQKGKIYWNAGSLHIYERDFGLLKNILEEYDEYRQ